MSEKLKKRILFVGMPDMALICLEGLVSKGANIVGAVGPKKNYPTFYVFKTAVKRFGINFLEYDNLDDETFINNVKALNADLAVVCSFNYKVPKVLLDSVKGGFVNVHPSLLPDYRGANPYTAVLLNKEKETGVTLHFMDETFDTGDIVAQEKLQISPFETMGTLFNRLNILALDMLVKLLEKYENSDLESRKQVAVSLKSAKNLPETAFRIDFSKTAEDIDFLIRSLNPFILAHTRFRKTFCKILSADIKYSNDSEKFPIGTIVEVSDDKFYVATSKGLIAPTSMQFGTFFAGTSKEFIKILNPKVGEKFYE